MAHNRLLFAVALTAIAFATQPAAAQSIDRAAFEDLFGEPVTTSATGAPQRASDVPAAMIIVTGDEVRRSGAANLAEVLRGRAGIDVMQVSANDYEVSIRGGNQPANPRLLVMVNGRQAYLDHYGLTSWTNLGVEIGEIRQIEIVKGPVSALFGFNAASGAINIVTYDPIAEKANSLSVEGGNDGQFGASAVATLKLGAGTGLRLSGGYAEQDEYPPVNAMSAHKPSRANGALDLRHQFSDKVNLRLNYSHSDSNQTILVPGFSAIGMNYVVGSALGEVTADTKAGLLSVSGQYNRLKNEVEAVPALMGTYAFRSNLWVARVQDLIKVGPRDTLRITLEYRNDSMIMTPDRAGEISYGIASGGLMWDHRLSDRVTFNLAGRVDHLRFAQTGAIDAYTSFTSAEFDRSLTPWSANASLLIKPDDRSTIRFQAARGLQAPSLVSAGISFVAPIQPGVDMRIMGTPSINPTISESGEIGYSREIGDNGTKFNGTLFYSRTRDVVGFVSMMPAMTPNGMLLGSTFANAGSYDSYGFEGAINGKLGEALSWRLDYTFNDVTEDFLPSQIPTDVPYSELTPRHKLGGEMNFTQGPVDINLRGYLRSKIVYPQTGLASADLTGRLDARIGFQLMPKVQLYAAGENLTGTDYVDLNFVNQSARVRVGLRVGG